MFAANGEPATGWGPICVDMLRNKMSVGDFVVVADGNLAFQAIGRVTGEYELLPDGVYHQMRPVEWLRIYEESVPVESISDTRFTQTALYELKRNRLKWDAFVDLLKKKDQAVLPHVLIIDEINRGNISKIFGELITLLEPDKRVGGENELTVTLPYSGAPFGVPANLHVIGTMNTADRSIAFLDTALRRRFVFEEMMPDADVIRAKVGVNGVVGGVDVARLLEVINRRVETLYDREHQIGHAYFLGVESLEDLRDIFVNNIVPLLQEYFYGDWRKVSTVLACPFGDEGGTAHQNGNPLLKAEPLKASELPGGGGDFDDDDQWRCSVNDAFLQAKGQELAAYFTGVIGS